MLTRFGGKRRILRFLGTVCFAVVPPRLMFLGLLILYGFRPSFSTQLARLYASAFPQRLVRGPLRSLASSISSMPRAMAHLLFELRQYDYCISIIEEHDLHLKDVRFLRILGLAFFELGRVEDTGACARLWPKTHFEDPVLMQTLAHFRLLDGSDEARSADLLRSAAQLQPAQWRPHQNLSAREPWIYVPTAIDLQAGGKGLLFDAYNYLAQRTEHVGRGDLSRELYANALRSQEALRMRLERNLELARVEDHEAPPSDRKSFVVSEACMAFLADKGIDLRRLRILPVEWTTQIGHEGMIDILFRMRELGWWDGQAVILARPETVANHLLLSLFEDQASVLAANINVDATIWAELASLQRMYGLNFKALEFLSGEVSLWQEAGALLMQKWEGEGRGYPVRDTFDSFVESTPTIARSVEDARKKWGMTPDDWYVCLHMRDPSHYREVRGAGQTHRNSDTRNYIEAVKYVTSQGGWVIKLGGRGSPTLPKMDRFIDYARSDMRSELFDLHLLRHCRFFIGTTSGLTNVAVSFGIPSALVNCITTDAQLWGGRVRFALKLVQLQDGKIVTQRELTSSPWRWRVFSADVLVANGAQLIDNTADEILELVKQVDALARGNESAYGNDMSAPNELLARWKASLAFPYFYGNAAPSLYFLKKHADKFLT